MIAVLCGSLERTNRQYYVGQTAFRDNSAPSAYAMRGQNSNRQMPQMFECQKRENCVIRRDCIGTAGKFCFAFSFERLRRRVRNKDAASSRKRHPGSPQNLLESAVPLLEVLFAGFVGTHCDDAGREKHKRETDGKNELMHVGSSISRLHRPLTLASIGCFVPFFYSTNAPPPAPGVVRGYHLCGIGGSGSREP